MSKLQFKIYIAGLNPRNKELVATFNRACAARLPNNHYRVDVVDITKHTAEAEKNKILATPTVIREKPMPQKRTIGEFKEITKAMLALEFLIEDVINPK